MSDFMRGVGTGFAGTGIAKAINNVALAPYLAAIQEQRARSEAALAALRDAKAGKEMMSQDMYGRMLGRYNDPETSIGEKNTIESMIAGMGNAVQLAKARQQGIANQHLMNIADMDETDPMKIKTAHFAVSDKAPYANANTPGAVLNELNGSTLISNPNAQSVWLNKVRSEIAENRAQAGNASAHAALAGKQGRYVDARTDYTNERKNNPERYQASRSSRKGLDFEDNPERQEYLEVRRRAAERGDQLLIKKLDELARQKGLLNG